MQDLARLGVGGGVAVTRLLFGQESEHSPGQAGLHQQHLAGGDQAITSEGTTEPGHTGIGIEAVVELGGKQMDVGGGAVDPGVESGVVGADRGVEQTVEPKPLHRGLQGRIEGFLGGRPGIRLRMEIQHQGQLAGAAGLQVEGETQLRFGYIQHLRLQPQGRASVGPVEAPVDHLQAVGGAAVNPGAAVVPVDAAHLEDVEKIGIHQQHQWNRDAGGGVAGEAQLLQQTRGSEHGAALQVHRARWQRAGREAVVAEMADVQPHFLPFGGGEHGGGQPQSSSSSWLTWRMPR